MFRNILQLSSRGLQGLNVAKVIDRYSYSQVQEYSRFTSRKPVAIVNEDELFEEPDGAYVEEEKILPKKRFRKHFRKNNDFLNNENKKGKADTIKKEMKAKTIDEKHLFTKLYENEKTLSPLMMNIRSKKQRQKLNKILLEGTRLITDAIQAGMIPEKLIFSNSAELLKLPLASKNIDTYKVPYRTIQLWSTLTTPSGIMAIFEAPDIEKFESQDSLPITILCDNIRDPGNLGSILRAAAGVGCDKVILSRGCVDLWDPKVLRSAAGAHFRLKIHSHKDWDEIRYLLSTESQFVIADNNVEYDLFNEEVKSEEIDESEREVSVKEKDLDLKKSKKSITIDLGKQIEVVPYYSVDYTQGETVIIIGGETEGLSEHSFNLASDNKGIRVNVPLSNGVESLNSGMALGIIAFEIKKQFLIAAEGVK